MEDCAECVWLWRLYANATAHHIGLQNDHRELAFRQLWESADLVLAVEAAARAREQARDAILTHEKIAHGSKTLTAGGGQSSP